MMGIKTIIADNQRMFVQGVSAYIESLNNPAIKLAGTVENAEKLLNELEVGEYDLLLMELNLPDQDGLAILPELREKYPKLRICIVTAYGDYRFVKDAFQRGADGFVVKTNPIEELMEGIVEVMDGNTFLSEGLRITPSSNRSGSAKSDKPNSNYEDKFLIKQKLTRREQEVLELIAEAKNNREIADELFISDQTVGVHRKNIMRKLGVRNTVNLIKFALENEIV